MKSKRVDIWKPSNFIRFEKSFDTSMKTALIVTDQGKAYCKAIGNPEGTHALACEWVGTKLANWFGLTTFDIAIIELDELDEITLHNNGKAKPGPAFVARAERGHTWGGSAGELESVHNQEDIAKLVVFDTWIRNRDRHPPENTNRKPNYDNVFFSHHKTLRGKFNIVAMDHTHCFTSCATITPEIGNIGNVKDDSVYGLFAAFKPIVTAHRTVVDSARTKLREAKKEDWEEIVASIPEKWDVPSNAREALTQFIYGRANFIADNIIDLLAPTCWPQGELDFMQEKRDEDN